MQRIYGISSGARLGPLSQRELVVVQIATETLASDSCSCRACMDHMPLNLVPEAPVNIASLTPVKLMEHLWDLLGDYRVRLQLLRSVKSGRYEPDHACDYKSLRMRGSRPSAGCVNRDRIERQSGARSLGISGL